MKHLLDFFSNAADGVLAVDQEHRIIFWNESAQKLLGYTTREVLGKFCYEVINGCHESGGIICHNKCLQEMLELGQKAVRTCNIKVFTKTGEEVWLNLSTILMPSHWRDICALVHLFRNVTYQKELERYTHQFLTTASKLSVEGELPPNRSSMTDLPTLTRREQEVLCLLASGCTTRVIADKLFITPATARNHIHNILAKLHVRNRLEAAILALRNGLI